MVCHLDKVGLREVAELPFIRWLGYFVWRKGGRIIKKVGLILVAAIVCLAFVGDLQL